MEWLTMAIGFILGLISSFLTSIIWDRYDRSFAQPVRELQALTRRIISALAMHARCLSSPAFIPTDGTPISTFGHEAAANELRALSTELSGLIAILPVRPTPGNGLKDRLTLPWRNFKYRHATKGMPPVSDLIDARRILMGLSNSLYLLPAGMQEDHRDQARENREDIKVIKAKLGIKD